MRLVTETVLKKRVYSHTVMQSFHRTLERLSCFYVSLIYLNQLAVVTSQGSNTNPKLTISPAIVTEGNSQTLTCTYTGSQHVSEILWSVNKITTGFFTVSGESCQVSFTPNATLYSHTCDVSSKTSTLTIKNVRRTNRHDQWDCSVKVPDVSNIRISSNVVKPSVKVLIASVSMMFPQTSTVTIHENTPEQFQCVTSGGLPDPTVKWYKDTGVTGNDDEITSSIVTSYSNTTDGLVKATSTLTFTPTKDDNEISIYCSAFTADQTPKHSTRKPKLNVLYGPDGAPTVQNYTDGATYWVIENTPGHLTCLIRGGNPLPTLTWSCYSTGTSDNTDADTVSKTVRWTVGRGSDRLCICHSTHFTGNGSITIKVQILYPPTTPVFYIQSTKVSDTVKFIKNNSVSITCNSSGKPNQIQYTWTPSTASSSGSVLNINRVQSGGQYTCNVQNTMDPSDDDAVPGRNSSSIIIELLYPPLVDDLVNRSVAEGDSLTVSCPVKVGNPANTTFIWTNSSGDGEWRTQTFTIDKVSRNDAKFFYTCEVANKMYQTGKEQAISKPDRKSFHLNVWYAATIKQFCVNGFTGNTTVTVNENGTVNFKCSVDSNPGSNMTVQNKTIGKDIASNTNSKSLEYKLNAATCFDAGFYTCMGFNQYNTKMSVKQLRLFVNCSPRPSPFIQLKKNITSAQHEATGFTFTALAYPEPTKNDFRWFRWNISQWVLLSNNVAYQIDTGGLQSNLTVKDVNRTSYGKYKMNVTNTVGGYEHIYHLLPEDKPEDPTDFEHVQELVSETSFTVRWKPGFDNGLDQVFILKYRKVSDQVWNIVNITDTGKSQMDYTVSGLSSGTNYQVVIYASNKLGNSSELKIASITTKAQDTPNIGPLIGGAVGGSVGLLLFIALGFLLIRKFRLGKGKGTSEVELNRRQMEDQDDESSEDEVITENAMYESAGGVVKKNLVDDNVYAKPQKKAKTNQDVYAVVNKGKKPGQKKKQKDKAPKNNTGDIYENAPDVSANKDKTYANSAYEDSPYEDANTATTSKHVKKNADGLIYADLAFNDQPKGQKKLVIHGLDSMTEYVEVDFTKKAEPLPDSDTEDQK